MSTPKTPATAPTAPVATPDGKPSAADVWAFRMFALLFLGTLVIGLLNFLLSYLKYRS